MATELTRLAVGDMDLTSPGRHPGVLLRDVTAPSLTDFLRPILALEPDHIEWMEDWVGRYPFDVYVRSSPTSPTWIYGEATPRMPSDLDWTVDPVEEVTALALTRSPARRR